MNDISRAKSSIFCAAQKINIHYNKVPIGRANYVFEKSNSWSQTQGGEPILEVYGQAWNKTQNFIAMRSKKKLLLIPTFLTQVHCGDTL